MSGRLGEVVEPAKLPAHIAFSGAGMGFSRCPKSHG
jgi:hypothetical protein